MRITDVTASNLDRRRARDEEVRCHREEMTDLEREVGEVERLLRELREHVGLARLIPETAQAKKPKSSIAPKKPLSPEQRRKVADRDRARQMRIADARRRAAATISKIRMKLGT